MKGFVVPEQIGLDSDGHHTTLTPTKNPNTDELVDNTSSINNPNC
jgi:hypothetical protein